MKASLTLFLSITGLLASSYAFTASGKVYKWTDEKGLIHYSERPPLGTQTEVVKPEIGRSEPVNYGAPSDEKAEKAKEGPKLEKKVDDEKSALKDPARCDSARKNLNVLKTYARIKLKGDDGEYRFLTPDEQKQKADEATKIIEESCE